jgi:hypothetical protein
MSLTKFAGGFSLPGLGIWPQSASMYRYSKVRPLLHRVSRFWPFPCLNKKLRSHTWLDTSTTRPTNLDCGLGVGLNVVLSHLNFGFGLELNGPNSHGNLGPRVEVSFSRDSDHMRTYSASISVFLSLLSTFMLTKALNSPPSRNPSKY